jgi:DNA-binding NarL/FixJ family response regulator
MPPCQPRQQTGGMQNSTAPATAPAPSPALLRVFVVEDSLPIRERIESMLADAGAAPAGHSSGVAKAIEAILLAQPDVVILDIQLADGTGFDVLRAIRKRAPHIGIYLLTNNAAYPYRQLAERLGARGFFDKTREFSQLRDTVAQHVRQH